MRGFPEREMAIGEISLGRALLLVARLGGYLDRRHDAPPGDQVVWEGYTRLAVGSQTLHRAEQLGEESAIHRLGAAG